MICLIANGRSGTNALYYHLFNMPNKYSSKEPWKNTKLCDNESFLKKQKMCEDLFMFHLKPRQHSKLSPKETIDLLIDNGVTKFIILKRKNMLALLVSNAFLKKKTNKKKQAFVYKEAIEFAKKSFYKFEDECLEYLKIKIGIRYLELIYEDHIKDDISVACDMVKKRFRDIPKDKYINSMPENMQLPSYAQNNNLKDNRPLFEKIANINEVIKYLGAENMWMLE